MGPDTVAQASNPSYLWGEGRGVLRSRGSWFEANIGKKVLGTPSQPIAGGGGRCLSSQLLREAQIERMRSRLDPSSKVTNAKRASRVVQVVEHLPSKHQP
jgi:hypothetical protein